MTGSEGQLAKAIIAKIANQSFDLVTCSHQQMDITDKTSIQRAIDNTAPDIIINTAAYTAVDDAEKNSDAAMRVNYLGVKNLAELCRRYNILLLHISTDYVFDGKQYTLYQEEDFPNPINVYGLSKWLGEKAITDHHDRYIILRVSGIFSEYNHNFLKTILRLSREKIEFNVVADQITCPTYAEDIADILFSLIKKKHKYGIYHYCNGPPISWFDFANTILSTCQKYDYYLNTKIIPVQSKDYKTLAARPSYSALNCSKIKKDYDIVPSERQPHIIPVIEKLLMGGNH